MSAAMAVAVMAASVACSGGSSDEGFSTFTTSGGTGEEESSSGSSDEVGETTTSGGPVCGDGMVEGDEECDLGPDNSESGNCTSACTIAACGDGFVYAGFEECDDGNDLDTDACIPTFCTLATCGDGVLHEGVETCDDGNLVDTDACPTSCEPAFCGDGFAEAGVEECDDGNEVDGDGCTTQCLAENKRAFVSSMLYDGNLGGLAGADAKCQALADAANLPGTYMAWISTAGGSPSTRFTQSTTPYVRVDGTQIAANWAALIDGSIDAALNLTESGGAAPVGNTSCAGGGHPTVWSATSQSGTYSGSACTDFTSTAGSGLWGEANMTNTSWTSWCSGGVCTWTSSIYCFQQ